MIKRPSNLRSAETDMSWLLLHPSKRHKNFEVIPLNDIQDHAAETNGDCWCEPEIEFNGTEKIIVHAAKDNRL